VTASPSPRGTTRARVLVFVLLLALLGGGIAWVAARDAADAGPSVEALHARGVALYHQRRYGAARAALERAAALAPDDAGLPALIGRCFLEERGTPASPPRTPAAEDRLVARAVEACERALALDPDEPVALQTLYVAHARPELRAFDPQRGLECAEALIAQRPDNANFILNFCAGLFENVRFPRATGGHLAYQSDIGVEIALRHAEALFDRAPVGSIERQEAARLVARAHTTMGEFEAARKAWRRLAETATRDKLRAQALIEAAFAAHRLGLVDEAVAGYRATVDHGESNADWARWLLAVLLVESGRGADAVPVSYRFARRQDPWPDAFARRWSFTDVAPRLGVDKRDGAGPSVFADLDGDARADLLAVGCDTFSRLYLQDGDGGFADVTVEAGLDGLEAGFAANGVDVDGDADLDLFVARYGWSGPGRNSLLRNDGGRFVDVTEGSGLEDASGSSFGTAWADFDLDGPLDLFVVNGILGDGSVPRLYRNRGACRFEDVTEAAGLFDDPRLRALGCAVGDYDRDGDPDLVVNRFGEGASRLYRNRGDGTFEDVAARAGVVHAEHAGYVAFLEDLDNDAWPDLLLTCLADWGSVLDGYRHAYVPPPGEPRDVETLKLFRNRGDGTFEHVSARRDVFRPTGTMGANLGDLDNDGLVDVYLGTGNPDIKRLEPNVLYANAGGMRFVDVTDLAGVGHVGKGHGVTLADHDADGDLDVYAPQGGFFHADLTPNALYRNDGGGRSASLRVRPRGRAPNPFAVGAQLRLETDAGVQLREIRAVAGFGSTSELVAHFGLGDARPLALSIRWPDGSEQRFGLEEVVEPGTSAVLEARQGRPELVPVPR